MRRRSPIRNWIEYGLVRFVLATLAVLPRRAAFVLGCFYTRLVDGAAPRFRRVARRNLERAYPEKDAAAREAIIDGVFRSLGRALVVFANLPSINKENVRDWIDYDGFEHFAEGKRRGRGVLFAAAHVGAWELSAYGHALMTEAMHVVVRPLDNPLVNALVERYRRGSGNSVIGKRELARSILRALAKNEAVGILIDQNSTAAEGIFIDFFGMKACAHSGFAKLAARSGAAVVPAFAIWDGKLGRYVLKFLPIVPMTGDAAADTQRLHSMLEGVVREQPDQWLWIHRRWKTRPPGEPLAY